MRRSCCGGFAAKPEQLSRGRVQHQAPGAPAHEPPRPDQGDDGDRAADQYRAAQHATDHGQAAIDTTQLVLDLLRCFTQLLTLHGDARQQVAVVRVELVETVAHCGSLFYWPTRERRLSRSFASSASVSSSMGGFSRSFLRSTSAAKIDSPTNMPIIAIDAAIRCVSQNAKMKPSAARNRPSSAVNAATKAHNRMPPTWRTSSCSSVVSSCRRVWPIATRVAAKLLRDWNSPVVDCGPSCGSAAIGSRL